jgi:hypothetical protein
VLKNNQTRHPRNESPATAGSSHIGWSVLGLLTAIALFSAANSQRIAAEEAFSPTAPEVMAAMIYNFALFIDWPTAQSEVKQSPFVIGVFGEDPIGIFLENSAKVETLQRRRVQIRHLATVNDVRSCRILVISQSQKKQVPEILDALRGEPILTVGDIDDFAEMGGMIAFKKEGNRIRFQINSDAATRVGLKISSKLLHLGIPAKTH